MSKNNGGPAFPYQVSLQSGMTLRDYFAAKAMQELLASFLPEAESQEVAKYAYAMADAMLAERGREQ